MSRRALSLIAALTLAAGTAGTAGWAGTAQASSGAVPATTGTTRASTGTTRASTGTTRASAGTAPVSAGTTRASTGTVSATTGTARASAETTRASAGTARTSAGTAWVSAGTWKWCSAKAEGTWQPSGGKYLVQNDMWNGGAGPQRICADSEGHWQATSTQAAGNTAVETYPDTGELFGTAAGQPADPVSGYKEIGTSFTESLPSATKGLSAEAADDVWLNNWGIEMMIWVDNVGRSLAGSTRLGTATISGQTFSVWKYGSTEFIFSLNHNETTGKTNILTSIEWLMKHGYVPTNATLTEAEFGFEVASTDGKAETFKMTKYSLSAKS